MRYKGSSNIYFLYSRTFRLTEIELFSWLGYTGQKVCVNFVYIKDTIHTVYCSLNLVFSLVFLHLSNSFSLQDIFEVPSPFLHSFIIGFRPLVVVFCYKASEFKPAYYIFNNKPDLCYSRKLWIEGHLYTFYGDLTNFQMCAELLKAMKIK